MDGLKRARDVKAGIEDNASILKHQDEKAAFRRHAQNDPESELIKVLRQDKHMKWKDITEFLNQECWKRGEAANFTDEAVYSRFVRNTPIIATAVSEIGFDPRDYVHLRHLNQNARADGIGTIGKAGKKRVKHYNNATELKPNMRKPLDSHENCDLDTIETTEQLMNAVAKVERNIWIIVADELERMTTKMYQPNELSSRYHAV